MAAAVLDEDRIVYLADGRLVVRDVREYLCRDPVASPRLAAVYRLDPEDPELPLTLDSDATGHPPHAASEPEAPHAGVRWTARLTSDDATSCTIELRSVETGDLVTSWVQATSWAVCGLRLENDRIVYECDGGIYALEWLLPPAD